VSPGGTETAKAERVEEMFRRAAEAIERRDPEPAEQDVAEFWHEDCEWTPLIAGVEGDSSYHGREGVLKFYEDLTSSFEVHYRDIQVRQAGDAVVFLSILDLRGRESGVEVERELGVVYEFDGDLIRRGRAFDSHAAALTAAEELSHA
jgi:ketosteroid isomerase-like protein